MKIHFLPSRFLFILFTFFITLIINTGCSKDEAIDDYTNTLKKAGAINENFKTWNILGVYVWPNNFVGNTYDEEINYLKDWVESRLTWLDGAINTL